MLFQTILRIIIVAVALTTVNSKLIEQKYCAECEEEVWEEVPCDAIFSPYPILPTTPIAVTTTSTPPPPPPTTTTPKTTTVRVITTTVAPPSDNTKNSSCAQVESKEDYKNCYCECKSGCREFCRKVAVNTDTKKNVLHLSKTHQTDVNGKVEVKHTHERNYIKTPAEYHQKEQQPEQKQQQPVQLAYVAESPSYHVEEQPAKLPYVAETPRYKSEPTRVPQYNPLPVTEKYQEKPQEQPQEQPHEQPHEEPQEPQEEPQDQPKQQPPQQNYGENALGFSYEELSKLLNSDDEYPLPGGYPEQVPTLAYPAAPYSSHPPLPYYAQSSFGYVSVNPLNLPNQPSYDPPIYGPPIQSPPSHSPPNYSPPNYSPPIYSPPVYSPPSYDPNPSYSPNAPDAAVDAQTAVSGDANAIAKASAPNNYKKSSSKNKVEDYSKEDSYADPPKGNYVAPTPRPEVAYNDDSEKSNNLPYDPAFNYMQELLYVSPPKQQTYRYSSKY